MTPSGASAMERFEGFPRGAQEMSAARLARDVLARLESAWRASGKKRKDLALELGVSESAVSQVFSGDGNLRVATLGRYLRALGYEANLELVPVSAEAAPIAGPRPRARQTTRSRPEDRRCEVSSTPGLQSDIWTVMSSGGDVASVPVKLHEQAAGLYKFDGICGEMKRAKPAAASVGGETGVSPTAADIAQTEKLLVEI